MLIEFLNTGVLSTFKVGDGFEKVRDTLGKPTTVSARMRKRRFPCAMKYGDLEIGFDQHGIISYLQFDYSEGKGLCGHENLSLENWPFLGGMTKEEVATYLRKYGVHCSESPDPINPEILSIKTEGGVIFSIVNPGVEFMGAGLVNVRVNT